MYGEQNEEVHAPKQDIDPLTKLNTAIGLSKTMPPSKLKKNLIGLISLVPQLEDNLLEKIDLPLQIDQTYPDFPFLKTQFNREGDSYRNPYTNYYTPQNSQGYRPSGIYRSLEENGAMLFAQYVKQYYGQNTVGNFYVMENDQGNFSCGFFAKKVCGQGDNLEGSWDSFNIVDVTHDGNLYIYKLATTCNETNLTGFLKKQKEERKTYQSGISEASLFEKHLVTIGQMIEDLQTVMRQHLQAIYVAKTKEIIFTTRYQNTIGMQAHRLSLANDLRKLRFGQ